MGDGRIGQWRFHPTRKISDKEQAIYWQQQYAQEKSRNKWLETHNEELARKVVALNQELTRHRKLVEFKTGEQVGNDNTWK